MAETMSSPQLKLADISEVPRLVVDLKLRTPGMARTASSTGVVTSTAICSAGRSPASRVMRTRGKLTCGKSPTGSEKLATAPARASVPSKNKMERAWLCAHAVKLIFLSQRPCRLPARNFLRSRPDPQDVDRPRALGVRLNFPRPVLLRSRSRQRSPPADRQLEQSVHLARPLWRSRPKCPSGCAYRLPPRRVAKP